MNMWGFELWLAVIASGLYHGLNPGMGWPLAVSAGLMEQRPAAVWLALAPLALGHFAAMALVLLPFAILSLLVNWRFEIQVGAAIGLIGFGIFRYFNRRHSRALMRIRPEQLALWSFAIAIAHGAGLMLVPLYLGLCTPAELREMGHQSAATLMLNDLAMALIVSAVHASAMIAAGGLIAWLVYRYLGLKFLSRSWLNLDGFWAVSLVLIGVLGLWAA